MTEATPGEIGFQDFAVRRHRSLWGDAWRRFRRHKLAMAGAVVLICFVVAALVGPLIYRVNRDAMDIKARELGLRLRLVSPVDAIEMNQLGQPRRHVDEGVPVPAARLEQQNAVVGVLAEAVGQHATRGARTDNDEIVFHTLAYCRLRES